MPEKANPMFELLESAVKNYEQAVQANLKIQEESAKWWAGFMAQAGLPQDWQKRVTSLASETFPVVQKRMEESVRLVEMAGRTSLDLWKQAVETLKADPVGANQSKVQDLWEASLQALRNNAQAVAQTNAKILDCWVQMFAGAAESAAAPKAKAS